MISKKEVNMGEKIEFDIIVGGKYKERVSHGVLIGLNDNIPSSISRSCSVMGLMSAYYALKDCVERDEDCAKLMAEFEKFKGDVLPELEKWVDELRAKVKEASVKEEN